MRIFLVGYMGSGKSTLGKKLAHNLELDFIDLDSYIEKEEGRTIAAIFDEDGEEEAAAEEEYSDDEGIITVIIITITIMIMMIILIILIITIIMIMMIRPGRNLVSGERRYRLFAGRGHA